MAGDIKKRFREVSTECLKVDIQLLACTVSPERACDGPPPLGRRVWARKHPHTAPPPQLPSSL
jgi:hypothetical protein